MSKPDPSQCIVCGMLESVRVGEVKPEEPICAAFHMGAIGGRMHLCAAHQLVSDKYELAVAWRASESSS